MAASRSAISRRNSRARARSITEARLGARPCATSRSSSSTVWSASLTAIWVVTIAWYPNWYSNCNRTGMPCHASARSRDGQARLLVGGRTDSPAQRRGQARRLGLWQHGGEVTVWPHDVLEDLAADRAGVGVGTGVDHEAGPADDGAD